MKKLTRRFLKRKTAVAGIVIVVLMVMVAILAPVLAPMSPQTQDLRSRLKGPGFVDAAGTHLLGTDQLGRDVLSRLIIGARLSLTVGVSAVLLGGTVGLLIGLVSGYVGGWADSVLMRFIDMQLAFPFLLLALTIVAVLGPNVRNVVIVLAITSWTAYAKVVRSATLAVKNQVFVEAAQAIGAPHLRIMLRHILPNIISPFIVVATFQVSRLIIAESSLSFLGLGVPTTIPTWGGMLSDGREYLVDAWWIAVFPGFMLMLASLSINLFGDGLRDALDPKHIDEAGPGASAEPAQSRP